MRAIWPTEGFDTPFVQDNQSLSAPAGTVRGLHFQTPPHGQAKLVRCVRGADPRLSRSTCGAVRRPTASGSARELSAENGHQLFDPGRLRARLRHARARQRGRLQGAPRLYAPESDGGVRWDDPAIGIDWPLPAARPGAVGQGRGPAAARRFRQSLRLRRPAARCRSGRRPAYGRHLHAHPRHRRRRLHRLGPRPPPDRATATTRCCVFDKLTYAGNLDSLEPRRGQQPLPLRAGRHLRRRRRSRAALAEFRPDVIIHLAAETHVDRSIDGPGDVHPDQRRRHLRRCSRRRWRYWRGARRRGKDAFRFLHVSHRRGVRLARRRRAASPRRRPTIRARPTRRRKAGVRPPGPRLAPHLRPAGADRPTARTTTGRISSPRS